MATRRTYGEACAMAHALDLVGERWALLVVRELLLGPKRFADLRAGIARVSANVLAQRLRELEAAGVVRRRRLGPPVGGQVYELTEWGAELEPAVRALGRWAARSPSHRPDIGMSTDSHVLAMRTMFDPARAEGLDAEIELRIAGDVFHARVRAGAFAVERGEARAPDAVVETDPPTLAGVLWGGLPLGEAVAAGALRIDGDEESVARYVTLFPLPDKAPATAA